MIKHVTLRILLLIILLFLAIPIAYSFLDPNRRCSTGDALSISFWMLAAYVIWSIYLVVESIFLHRKKEITKRNFNLIAVFILPLLLFLISACITLLT